jgi:predicted glycoside hydrolase/deacetylase ChbG (UPF0249 family)
MTYRRVVVHQDDVGMCHGANVAFLELSRRGVVTSGSVMGPCPWFPEIAIAAWLERQDLEPIGMRTLRDAYRDQ